jgi:hypothetical protein
MHVVCLFQEKERMFGNATYYFTCCLLVFLVSSYTPSTQSVVSLKKRAVASHHQSHQDRAIHQPNANN